MYAYITAANASLRYLDHHIVLIAKLWLWPIFDDDFFDRFEDERGVLSTVSTCWAAHR